MTHFPPRGLHRDCASTDEAFSLHRARGDSVPAPPFPHPTITARVTGRRRMSPPSSALSYGSRRGRPFFRTTPSALTHFFFRRGLAGEQIAAAPSTIRQRSAHAWRALRPWSPPPRWLTLLALEHNYGELAITPRSRRHCRRHSALTHGSVPTSDSGHSCQLATQDIRPSGAPTLPRAHSRTAHRAC
jgi:hypothetical protein